MGRTKMKVVIATIVILALANAELISLAAGHFVEQKAKSEAFLESRGSSESSGEATNCFGSIGSYIGCLYSGDLISGLIIFVAFFGSFLFGFFGTSLLLVNQFSGG